MRFGAVCMLLTLTASVFSQETATIDITTLVKAVEVVIDGKSLGCHDHVAVSRCSRLGNWQPIPS